ncbi:hypothetical protein RSAG8_05752, partial [Rhizoctonia solani AG-8 WAC10335]
MHLRLTLKYCYACVPPDSISPYQSILNLERSCRARMQKWGTYYSLVFGGFFEGFGTGINTGNFRSRTPVKPHIFASCWSVVTRVSLPID